MRKKEEAETGGYKEKVRGGGRGQIAGSGMGKEEGKGSYLTRAGGGRQNHVGVSRG